MLEKEKPILIVDDIQPSRETIINILRVLGYENFLEATNGKEAQEILKEEKDIQLIICDWKMPVMSGLELLKWVRSNNQTEDIPFLFVTSKGEKEDIAIAAEEGVTGYIVKPIDIDVFVEKLEDIDKQKRSQKEIKDFLERLAKFIKAGDLENAEKELEQFLLKNTKPKPNVLVEAAALFSLVDDDKANHLIDEALKENSLYIKGWLEKAKIYEKNKNYNSALECLKKAYDINPNSSKTMFRMGRIYLFLQEINKAKNFFLMALKADPNNDQLKQDIWNSYLELDLVDEVLKDFEHILFDKLTVETLNNLAVSLRKRGKTKEAIKAYRQALKKEPDNEKIHYNIAVAYLDTKRNDLAIQHLEKAVEINPEFDRAAKLLGKIANNNK